MSLEDVGGRGLVSSEPVFFTSSRNNEEGMRDLLRKELASFDACMILELVSPLDHQGPTAGTVM